jgi:glycerol-3-phosphate dehydrogenase (NAD(P)+)
VSIRNVTVLGAGGWGTALAVHLARIGHEARLWARDGALAADIQHRRFNPVYLPEIRFPANLRVTADLADALDGSELVVAAVPSHGTREVLRWAAPHIRRGSTLVSATKGLEQDTLLRMSQIVEQECPARRVAVLSGPSFAIELARELPTAVSIASRDPVIVELVQAEFKAPYFRLYGTDDVVGVEIGGALKNIIAIAAGVVEGLGLGHNALAGLITRGLAEMSRLACAAGAKRETLAGLTGLGDLVLTCTGRLSRNRHVGVELASGRALQDVLGGMKMVAEGVRTTEAALALAARHGVELPIAAQVAELLTGRKDARTALSELMIRPQRAEVG